MKENKTQLEKLVAIIKSGNELCEGCSAVCKECFVYAEYVKEAKHLIANGVVVVDGSEVRVSKVCPVYDMDGLVRAAKRGEIASSSHVDETCLGGRVFGEEDV